MATKNIINRHAKKIGPCALVNFFCTSNIFHTKQKKVHEIPLGPSLYMYNLGPVWFGDIPLLDLNELNVWYHVIDLENEISQ